MVADLMPASSPGSFVQDDRVHLLALRPAQIHAQQNGGPVLRLRAAGAGLDGHDGVQVIVFAGEQRLRFEFGDIRFGVVQFAIEIFQQLVALLGVGFFLREIDVGFDVFGNGGEFFVGADLVFGAFAVAQNGLCGFLVVPEIGVGDACFERLSGVRDAAGASKITPHKSDALLQAFVLVLQDLRGS